MFQAYALRKVKLNPHGKIEAPGLNLDLRMDEYFAKCSINPVRLNPQRKNNRVIGNLRYARNKREIAALRPLA